MSEHYGPTDQARWVAEPAKSPSRTEFERDRARVLHSSALRRLGAKTQVLGPESDDFIRTRLTHSLEVAQIGRSLGKNLGCDPDIVETACLCHDLGHPPFGHNGEHALDEVAKDIGGFEGNAQTLRLLTRLEPKRLTPEGEPAGLNLTRASLDAVLKYPWFAGESPSGSKKFNVYRDDAPVFEWIHGAAAHAKCIEAQIMDLADDIAYCVHDVEDAMVREFVSPNTLRDPRQQAQIVEATCAWYNHPSPDRLGAALQRLIAEEDWPTQFAGSYRDLAQMKDLTSDLIGRFISSVCEATYAAHGTGPLVRYDGNVVIPQETQDEITVLKGIAVEYVMMPRESEPLYFEQRTLLFDLVDALQASPEQMEPHFFDMWKPADEAARQRVVVDQVASLTDQSARQWHSRLCGMFWN
ncbi:deoxyguanosinetriphosphate triphosphohydrolase [Ancrocorticia populi]|uniref:deoxyguanosinetriphosphate triphosphohydrolase n=1 Tax=Ancrocorticia populi TaxID=2175228 RepID=UPI003F952516